MTSELVLGRGVRLGSGNACAMPPPSGRTETRGRSNRAHQPQADALDAAPIGATINDSMASELRAVVDELGGEAVLGRRLKRDTDLQTAIREGFPQQVIEEVMEAADLSIKELAACLDLSPRSLQRRRREGRLAPYESDRIYRLARIVALAKSALGNREAATRWLKRPNRALGGKAPLAVIDTEIGARAVENVLGRIAFGGVS